MMRTAPHMEHRFTCASITGRPAGRASPPPGWIGAGRPRKAFTLIELLVVVAIIAILAALLLPALRHARSQATNVVCKSNMKQAFVGITMYAGDEDGYFPGGTWLWDNAQWLWRYHTSQLAAEEMRPYVTPSVLVCAAIAGGRFSPADRYTRDAWDSNGEPDGPKLYAFPYGAAGGYSGSPSVWKYKRPQDNRDLGTANGNTNYHFLLTCSGLWGGDTVGGRQHYWGFLNGWALWGRVHGKLYPWDCPWDNIAGLNGGSRMNLILLDGGIREIEGVSSYPMQGSME